MAQPGPRDHIRPQASPGHSLRRRRPGPARPRARDQGRRRLHPRRCRPRPDSVEPRDPLQPAAEAQGDAQAGREDKGSQPAGSSERGEGAGAAWGAIAGGAGVSEGGEGGGAGGGGRLRDGAADAGSGHAGAGRPAFLGGK